MLGRGRYRHGNTIRSQVLIAVYWVLDKAPAKMIDLSHV